MPSRFWEQSQRYVMPQLLSQFGETVEVAIAGSPRTVEALVERSPPVIFDEAGGAYMDDFVIRVKDDPILGVQPAEITRGQTRVTLQARASGTAGTVVKTVVAIENQANGILQVRLR